MAKKRKGESPKTSSAVSTGSSAASATSGPPPSSGFLLKCDVPTKQFVRNLNEAKSDKFILEDLDATHLLVKASARAEIMRKVDKWMDENVFSSVERVGEDLDLT